jgi:hypothetical protein
LSSAAVRRPLSTRARSARVRSALGRPRPSTLSVTVRCNDLLGAPSNGAGSISLLD